MDANRVEPPQGAPVSIRIDCVTRTDRVSPHHRIRAIGGTGRDGEEWRLGEAAAIAAIENERASFYVDRPGGTRVEVVVGEGSTRPTSGPIRYRGPRYAAGAARL